MELLSAGNVERIYRQTDELELRRDWVVVPLNCAKEGMEVVLPDGKVLIRAPEADAFEPWLQDLKTRLLLIDLTRTPRLSAEDPNKHLSAMNGYRSTGTRGYLKCQPNLNVCDDPH
jgi:hypothetical protein